AGGVPEAHNFVALGAEDGTEYLSAYVDTASIRRTGDVAEADGVLIPTDGTPPYPNYVTGHVRVQCAARTGSITGTRIVTLAGEDAGPAHADVDEAAIGGQDEE